MIVKHISYIILALFLSLTVNAQSYENLYIIGSATEAGWNLEEARKMSRVGNNLFVWEGELKSNGEFKFLPERDWSLSLTPPLNEFGNVIVSDGELYTLSPRMEYEYDNKFCVDQRGKYNVVVDLNAMQMVCMLEQAIPELSLAGSSFGSSDERIFMTDNGDGSYTWTGDLKEGTDFIILTSGKEYPCLVPSQSAVLTGENCEFVLAEINSGEDYESFVIETGGNYTITVYPALFKMYIEFHPEELYICGNALCGRQGVWHRDDRYIVAMQPTEIPHEFRWDGFLYSLDNDDNQAEFKFRKWGVDNGSWDGFSSASTDNVIVNIGDQYPIADTTTDAGAGDCKFIVPDNGRYTIIANTATLTMTVYTEWASSVTVLSQPISFKVLGRNIVFENPSAGLIEIFDITGTRIAYSSEPYGCIELNARGFYIISCNGKSSKVIIN